jgi:dTDP-glucose 4,6-dehydratase
VNILVTGGIGFIGSNFIRRFVKNKDSKIINLDSLSYGSNQENLRDLAEASDYTFIKADVSNEKTIGRIVGQVDAIVNFAAETHVDRSISSPKKFIKANILGVYSILEAMRKARNNVRLVHVGTDEEYGDISSGSFTEDDELNPSSPYAASKAAASMLIHAYHRTYGLDTIITRCTNNFGPYQFPEKLIPKTIIRAKLGLKIPLYGKGKNVRDWIYVEDHCEAIETVLNKGKAGEIYNISSGNELENIEVVSTILKLMNKPTTLIEYVEDRPGHDLRYSLDSSKIRNQLGWRPKHTFHKALSKTVNWYVNNERWWKPLADEKILHPTPWKTRW